MGAGYGGNADRAGLHAPAGRAASASGRGLSKFLHRRGLAAADVEPEVIEQFVAALRAKNSSGPTARSLSWLVDYLRQIGVATGPAVPRERTDQQELIERYRDYLGVERGLEPVTIANYVRVVTRFLAAQRGRQLDALSAADVSGFITSQCGQVSARQAERLATGLRSFLRFALVEGLISRPLTGAVPSVARWSGAGLPRGLTSKQVVALLASCDRRRPLAGATTRSWCCWCGWGCGPARSPR